MALTAARHTTLLPKGSTKSFRVQDTIQIFHGAFVGVYHTGANQGRVSNWADGSDVMYFAGVAQVTGDDTDSVTGDTAGTVECVVDVSGATLVGFAVTGFNLTSEENQLVYGADEETLTLTATAGGNAVGVTGKNDGTDIGDVHLFSYETARAANP